MASKSQTGPSQAGTAGNQSQPPSSNQGQTTRSQPNPTATRKATGPRTAQGKARSKLNALKHGLFSKVVLMDWESKAEYLSLLNGLQDDFQPQGKLESILVDNLAVLFWRKRRFFLAEGAVISENIAFTNEDFAKNRFVDTWEFARTAVDSGGLLKHMNDPLLVREAKDTFELLRSTVIKVGFIENCHLINKLYGRDRESGLPYSIRLFYEIYAKDPRLAEKQNDQPSDTKERASMVEWIEAEIKRLTVLEKMLEANDRQRMEYKTLAAVIPGQEESDRLLGNETHFSREIEKILSRLERVQRMRRGQPVFPPAKVDVTL
jgi:hypothetical protein